jgi:hypothetical protein
MKLSAVGEGAHTPTLHAGWVTNSDGGGRGRWYHVPTLLRAGEVHLVFWVMRWKEKGNIQTFK